MDRRVTLTADSRGQETPGSLRGGFRGPDGMPCHAGAGGASLSARGHSEARRTRHRAARTRAQSRSPRYLSRAVGGEAGDGAGAEAREGQGPRDDARQRLAQQRRPLRRRQQRVRHVSKLREAPARAAEGPGGAGPAAELGVGEDGAAEMVEGVRGRREGSADSLPARPMHAAVGIDALERHRNKALNRRVVDGSGRFFVARVRLSCDAGFLLRRWRVQGNVPIGVSICDRVCAKRFLQPLFNFRLFWIPIGI